MCNACKVPKEINIENYRQLAYPSGKLYFKSICRQCESLKSAAYNKTHSKSEEQKQKFKLYKKQWRQTNKSRENQKYKTKWQADPDFRLKKNISRAVNRSIKKDMPIKLCLNYNINNLKHHLEQQFDSNMSWDNYGTYWHIDHIVPQSCLPYSSTSDDNFKICWALTNLRPLEAKQNMLDGSTRIRHKLYASP